MKTSETNATPVSEDATAASISATEHKTKAMVSDKLSQQQSQSQPEFKSATDAGSSNVKQTVASVQPPSPPAASYPQVPSNQDKIKSSDQRQYNKQALRVETQKVHIIKTCSGLHFVKLEEDTLIGLFIDCKFWCVFLLYKCMCVCDVLIA